MKNHDLISDEQLNAFIDKELETEEENSIFNLLDSSPELNQRVCEMRKTKEMLRHAYRDLPQPRRRLERKIPRGRLLFAAVAALFMAIGAASGWFGSQYLNSPPNVAGRVVTQPESHLLHIATSDPQRMRYALQRAGDLIQASADGRLGQIEVVANEAGLELLRSDLTPYGDQIRLLHEHEVLFFACTKAIARLEEKGIKVHLVPEANREYSALDRVVLRMNEGWAYEKI